MVTLHCLQALLQKNYSSAIAALLCNDFLCRHPTRSRSRPSSSSGRSQRHRRADPPPSSPSSFTQVYMPGAMIVRGQNRGRGGVFERSAGVIAGETTPSPWIFTAFPLPLYLTNAVFFTLFSPSLTTSSTAGASRPAPPLPSTSSPSPKSLPLSPSSLPSSTSSASSASTSSSPSLLALPTTLRTSSTTTFPTIPTTPSSALRRLARPLNW